jgi:DNA-directed RNA polymerase subunit RPC12/RpoP
MLAAIMKETMIKIEKIFYKHYCTKELEYFSLCCYQYENSGELKLKIHWDEIFEVNFCPICGYKIEFCSECKKPIMEDFLHIYPYLDKIFCQNCNEKHRTNLKPVSTIYGDLIISGRKNSEESK